MNAVNPGPLDMSSVEVAFVAALDQHDADRRRGTFQPNEWAQVSAEVYGWPRAKTYLAVILVGLLARSVNAKADPHSLQVSDGAESGSYNAHAVWEVIRGHGQGRIFLRNLKGLPFNNSPFNGKKFVSRDWANVLASNAATFGRLNDLLDEIAVMTPDEAREALRSFLYAAPQAKDTSALGARIGAAGIDLPRLFSEVEQFLQDNAENGRRGQALVAACLALLHDDDVDTPTSIHDPSRTAPGDVRVMSDGPPRMALFVEAKQQVVKGEALGSFAEGVHAFDAAGVTGYAALANRRIADAGRLRREVSLPDWRAVLEETGVLMSVWDNPADLIRDAIVWSGMDVTTAVAQLTALYARFLRHVEVDQDTVPQWRDAAARFGVILEEEMSEAEEPEDR